MDKLTKSSDIDEVQDVPIRVKSEPGEDTIKNYAENTMNELLGLFGYEDKINSSDTKNLNLDNYTDGKDTGSDVNSDDPDSEKEDIKRRRRQRLRQKLCGLDVNSLAQQHMNLVTALKRKEHGEAAEATDLENGQVDPSLCAWCRKPGNKQFSLEGPNGVRVFCSEVCFTQCRRATFKKTRVCDWCKHVRHTVNYVELNDGDTQLQFCTEKCLNQYKMSIFCKETQEHLQKMSDKTAEDSSGESDSERAILITPDLWLKSENRNNKERMGDKKRSRIRPTRINSPENKTRSQLMNDSTYGDTVGSVSSKKFKTEGGVRQRKFQLVRERSQSPKGSEPQVMNPSPHPPAAHGTLPPNMLHPALAGMTPWLPAQFMGALTPGMVPFPGFSPLMFQPGIVPQFAAMVQGDGNRVLVKDKEPGERDQKVTGKKEPLNYSQVNRLLSPTSDRSSVSDTSSHDISHTRSPSASDKRTSSLFPVDFPQLFAGHGFGQQTQQQSSTRTGNTNSSTHETNLPKIPPVTMMVPFPVVVPFPVPIPIPIPLTYQQLKTLFGHNQQSSSSHRDEKRVRLIPERVHEEISPRSYSVQSPMSTTSVSDKQIESHDVRAGSRNSCPDLSNSFGLNDKNTTETYKYLKRSRTPDTARSLDLSNSAKRYRYELLNGNSEDGAIDLSSNRHNGNSLDDRSSENSMDIRSLDDDDKEFLRDEDDNLPEKDSTLPKIHIITHDEESPPLNQALPLPPTENSYSTRRGLILDAPTVPKKSRSPSPQERRLYVRNVPRDIIEAARRRCMRTRIRTK